MGRKFSGMTLIELLIVVVVIAILASIAVPTYQNHVLKTHRVEAKSALLNLASAQERFYLQNNTYATDDDRAAGPPTGLGIPDTTENGWYTIEIADGANSSGFTASATAAGSQARDTHCASFSIDETGDKDATNADCWN